MSYDQVKNERPELTEARVVVSGGRALKERFNEVLAPLADTLAFAAVVEVSPSDPAPAGRGEDVDGITLSAPRKV